MSCVLSSSHVINFYASFGLFAIMHDLSMLLPSVREFLLIPEVMLMVLWELSLG